MSADLIVIGLVAFACTVFIGLLLAELAREILTDRRTRAYEQGRDAAVAARLAEDAEVKWLHSIPTMKWDPEVLGS